MVLFLMFIFTCVIKGFYFSLFRPSGWDNIKKISILYENLVSMKHDDYYRNVISPPVTARKVRFQITFLSLILIVANIGM